MNTGKKVVLVVANYRWFNMRPWDHLTYAVPIITAILNDNFDFSVIDANGENLSQEETKIRIKNSNADIILITALSMEYQKQYHEVAKLSKEVFPKSLVIMGGVYPTVMKDEVLNDRNIDYIFIGHAEERLDKFIELLIEEDLDQIYNFDGIGYINKQNKTTINPVKSYIGDLKNMVKPNYSKIDLDNYIQSNFNKTPANYLVNTWERSTNIITSYGCPYNCIFCATKTISGKKVAFRKIEDVLEEIEFFIKNYKVTMINFLDDCILYDRDRAIELFNEFIKREYNLKFKITTVSAWHLDEELLKIMKKAGCIQFGISVESGCDRVLHKIIRKPLKKEIIPNIVKICRQLGIIMTANFVIGFPGETWDEIRETFRFAESCDFDLINIHIATVLPETDLYKIALEQDLLPKDFSFYDCETNFGYCKGNITTNEFTPFELMILRAFEWDRINFSTPEKIENACKIMGITYDELQNHRKNTRVKCGVHF